MEPVSKALAIIGGGTMARAILNGATVLGRNGIRAWPVIVAEPDQSKHTALRALGVDVVGTAKEAVERLMPPSRETGEGAILLAVKPQSLEEVGREIAPLLAEGQ